MGLSLTLRRHTNPPFYNYLVAWEAHKNLCSCWFTFFFFLETGGLFGYKGCKRNSSFFSLSLCLVAARAKWLATCKNSLAVFDLLQKCKADVLSSISAVPTFSPCLPVSWQETALPWFYWYWSLWETWWLGGCPRPSQLWGAALDICEHGLIIASSLALACSSKSSRCPRGHSAPVGVA